MYHCVAGRGQFLDKPSKTDTMKNPITQVLLTTTAVIFSPDLRPERYFFIPFREISRIIKT